MNRSAASFLLWALAVGITAVAGPPGQGAAITARHGNIERLEVDAGRLVEASVAELVRRHLYDLRYEDPRFSDSSDYVDIAPQVSAVPARSTVLVLRNRQMSLDLDTARGVE